MFRLPWQQLLWLLLLAAQHVTGKFDSISSVKVDGLVEEEQDFFVISYTQNCKTCDRFMDLVQENLQLLDPGYKIYKTNDKKLQKSLNIRNFPALTKYQQGKPVNYADSLEDAIAIVDFIQEDTAVGDSEEKIELVDAEELEEIIACESLVAVIFDTKDNNKNEVETVHRLIQDFQVRVVLTKEFRLLARYKITSLPGLVLFRNKKKVQYTGNRSKEDIIKWLVANKKIPEEVKETVENIEDTVETETLSSILKTLDDVFVYFYDQDTAALDDQIMEYIHRRKANFYRAEVDECEPEIASYAPGALVFFSQHQAYIYEGELTEPELRLWISKMLNKNPQNRWIVQVMNEYKAFMINFCKYTAYSAIALIHTCFLLKNIYSNKAAFSLSNSPRTSEENVAATAATAATPEE